MGSVEKIFFTVIPAKAGIPHEEVHKIGIPAFAGMTTFFFQHSSLRCPKKYQGFFELRCHM
jgi:hypothetical protein